MSAYSVGKEVLSYCGKCKLSLYHIIVVMKDAAIPGRVQCLTCKSTHTFKDPNAAKAAKKTPSTRGRRPKAEVIPLAEAWQNAISEAKGSAIKYSIKSEFKAGDVLDHPKFGQGYVEKSIDNDKIEVMFQSEIKTLVHNR